MARSLRLLLVAILLAVAAFAQSPMTGASSTGPITMPGLAVTALFTTSTTTSSPAITLIGSGVMWHRIVATANGTVSALTFTVDTSADGISWTAGGAVASTNNLLPPGATTGVNGVAANYVRITVATLTGGGTVNFRYEGYLSAADPCNAPWTVKLFQGFNNITAANKTVPLVAGARTYVCAVHISNSGTTPTVVFQSGTGTTCGTGTVNILGTVPLISSQPYTFSSGTGAFADTSIGRDFCITPGGTTPSASGVVTYVVQ